MSCQFLHKLAPELRERIYQYALDFCDTPLRNVGLLQPFVKNFTGAQGGLRLGYEDPMGGDSVITRVAFDEPLFDSPSIDTAILCTCKRIYREGKSSDLRFNRVGPISKSHCDSFWNLLVSSVAPRTMHENWQRRSCFWRSPTDKGSL